MAFAGRTGLRLDITSVDQDPIRALFSEELGAIVQIRSDDREWFTDTMEAHGLMTYVHHLGRPSQDMHMDIYRGSRSILRKPILELYELWTECSHHIQKGRDNPDCAESERRVNLDPGNTGLFAMLILILKIPFYPPSIKPTTKSSHTQRTRRKWAYRDGCAFDRVGFSAIDVHMMIWSTEKSI